MTLVDYDEVEEVSRELAEQLLPFVRPRDRLVWNAIHLAAKFHAFPSQQRNLKPWHRRKLTK